jgi:hypothetical protein
MSSISYNAPVLLPDPDLIAKAISHIRALNQTTIDAINAGAERALKDSEPWQARKNTNAANPLATSPKDILV